MRSNNRSSANSLLLLSFSPERVIPLSDYLPLTPLTLAGGASLIDDGPVYDRHKRGFDDNNDDDDDDDKNMIKKKIKTDSPQFEFRLRHSAIFSLRSRFFSSIQFFFIVPPSIPSGRLQQIVLLPQKHSHG